jgi:CHAD domain-containing protein
MQLRRVEVEVQPEWLEALTPLVEQLRMACGLQPAALSKFEAGLLALGVELPAAPDLGPTSVGPDSTTGDLAYAVLRRQVAVLRDKEPGTRLGEDIEELHDMRVATRRLRAALDVFEEVLPVRARTYRDELGWLAGVLGAVRDLDVQQEALPGMSATANAWASLAGGSSNPLADLAALLERERASARAAMLDSLDSLRWDRLINGLTAMVRQGPLRRSLAVRTPALIAVPELVGARHRAAVKAARRAKRSGQAPDFHRLRIRCKRLRYSLEFTADLYGGRTTRYTRQLTSLQDKLGLMQDAEVAADRLADLALGEAHLPASTVFVMGAVAEHHRRDSERLLRRLPKQVSRLGGQRWRDLADLMEQERARALALQPPVRRTLRAVPTPTTEAAPPASGEPSSPTDPSTRAEPTIAADPSTPSEFEVGHAREEVRQTEGPV